MFKKLEYFNKPHNCKLSTNYLSVLKKYFSVVASNMFYSVVLKVVVGCFLRWFGKLL